MKLVRQFIILCFLGNLAVFALWSFLQQTRTAEWIKPDKLLQLSRLVIPSSILGSKNPNVLSGTHMLQEKTQADEVKSTFETQPRKRLITPGDKEKQLKQGLGSLKKKMFVDFSDETPMEGQDRQEPSPIVEDIAGLPDHWRTVVQDERDLPDHLHTVKQDVAGLPDHWRTAEQDVTDLPDHWRTVLQDVLYVFSAYVNEVDHAGNAVVEVVGMKKTDLRDMNIKCVFRYESGESEATVVGRLSDTGNENTKRVLAFQASTIICDLPDSRIPRSCTIVSHNSIPNVLHVHYAEKYSNVEGSIHVCFAPFYNMYDDVSHVVEFVELHSLLGVSHFTFFNLSIGPGMDRVLQYYKQQGIATVLQYELPHPREIHIRGHHITVHDCRLRSRGAAEYLLLIDPDETIFPMQYESLLPQLRALDSPTVSGFIFPCLYFCMEKTDNKTALSYMDAVRIKYHDVPRSNAKIVSTEAAALHHYRTCESGGHLPYPDVCPKRDLPRVDLVAHRYMHKLIPTVYQVMRTISSL